MVVRCLEAIQVSIKKIVDERSRNELSLQYVSLGITAIQKGTETVKVHHVYHELTTLQDYFLHGNDISFAEKSRFNEVWDSWNSLGIDLQVDETEEVDALQNEISPESDKQVSAFASLYLDNGFQ